MEPVEFRDMEYVMAVHEERAFPEPPKSILYPSRS